MFSDLQNKSNINDFDEGGYINHFKKTGKVLHSPEEKEMVSETLSTYTPLTTMDEIKIFSLPLMAIPLILYLAFEEELHVVVFLFALYYIPSFLILAIGTSSMKSKKSFSSLDTSLLIIGIYFLFTVIYFLNRFLFTLTQDDGVARYIIILLMFSLSSLAFFYILKYLYYLPLKRHQDWIIKNGILSKTERIVSDVTTDELYIKIQNLLDNAKDRDILVNKLKKLLLRQGYEVVIEEEYLIQFKEKKMFDGQTVSIDLEPYSK